MTDPASLLLAAGMLVGALLYSSVGHAGASAYIALMALAGMAPEEMRPTALVLNILVASFASARYLRAGQFRWRTLWPFLAGAVPLAFIGGGISLPGHLYKPLVGLVLWASAARLLWPKPLASPGQIHNPAVLPGMACGAGIGLLAGLTGTGGGIFLSPLLLFARWSDARRASGIAIVFILANSLAGLAGNYASLGALPAALPLYAAAVLTGALIGTRIGIRVAPAVLLRLLALVLLIAGAKLLNLW